MTEIQNENVGQETQTDNGGEGQNQRSEKRFQDLAEKVRIANEEKTRIAEESAQKIAEAEKKASEAMFKAGLMELSTKYPNAKDFEADIKTKVSSGYTTEDAIVSVLASKGQLPVNVDKGNHLGGSAETPVKEIRSDDPTFGGDTSKMREALLDMERKNEIGTR